MIERILTLKWEKDDQSAWRYETFISMTSIFHAIMKKMNDRYRDEYRFTYSSRSKNKTILFYWEYQKMPSSKLELVKWLIIDFKISNIIPINSIYIYTRYFKLISMSSMEWWNKIPISIKTVNSIESCREHFKDFNWNFQSNDGEWFIVYYLWNKFTHLSPISFWLEISANVILLLMIFCFSYKNRIFRVKKNKQIDVCYISTKISMPTWVTSVY